MVNKQQHFITNRFIVRKYPIYVNHGSHLKQNDP